MQSYTSRRNLYGQLSNNTQSNNLTLGDTLMNQYDFEYLHQFPGIYQERTDTTSIQTQPSVQFYTLPQAVRKVKSIVVTVGNFNWTPIEISTIGQWNAINLTSNITSDIPVYWYQYNRQIGLYPKPSNGYNAMTLRFDTEPSPLSLIDVTSTLTAASYNLTLTGALASGATTGTLSGAFALTTGTYEITFSNGNRRLATCTNASTAITFPAITATATAAITVRTSTGGEIITVGALPANVGATINWYVNFAQNTASTSGDGDWYQVETAFSSTIFSLKTRYGGGTTAASGTVTFGQMSPLPETYQILSVYRALDHYYSVIAPEVQPVKAPKYKALADELFSQLKADYGEKSEDPTVQDYDKPILNPNLTIQSSLT